LFLSRTDDQLALLLRGCALLAAAIVLLILLFLVKESWPVLQHVALMRFITDASWHPVQGLYQLTPMLSATLYSTLGAVCWLRLWASAQPCSAVIMLRHCSPVVIVV
jgi:phosphate transport system permease protein